MDPNAMAAEYLQSAIEFSKLTIDLVQSSVHLQNGGPYIEVEITGEPIVELLETMDSSIKEALKDCTIKNLEVAEENTITVIKRLEEMYQKNTYRDYGEDVGKAKSYAMQTRNYVNLTKSYSTPSKLDAETEEYDRLLNAR